MIYLSRMNCTKKGKRIRRKRRRRRRRRRMANSC
jgi:hypothetical protein